MLITIHNLPPTFQNIDIKSLIHEKCGLSEVIVDNLVHEGKGKRVTVGVPDEGDAAIIVRKINGLYLKGQQLYVEVGRKRRDKDQPYRKKDPNESKKPKPTSEPVPVNDPYSMMDQNSMWQQQMMMLQNLTMMTPNMMATYGMMMPNQGALGNAAMDQSQSFPMQQNFPNTGQDFQQPQMEQAGFNRDSRSNNEFDPNRSRFDQRFDQNNQQHARPSRSRDRRNKDPDNREISQKRGWYDQDLQENRFERFDHENQQFQGETVGQRFDQGELGSDQRFRHGSQPFAQGDQRFGPNEQRSRAGNFQGDPSFNQRRVEQDNQQFEHRNDNLRQNRSRFESDDLPMSGFDQNIQSFGQGGQYSSGNRYEKRASRFDQPGPSIPNNQSDLAQDFNPQNEFGYADYPSTSRGDVSNVWEQTPGRTPDRYGRKNQGRGPEHEARRDFQPMSGQGYRRSRSPSGPRNMDLVGPNQDRRYGNANPHWSENGPGPNKRMKHDPEERSKPIINPWANNAAPQQFNQNPQNSHEFNITPQSRSLGSGKIAKQRRYTAAKFLVIDINAQNNFNMSPQQMSIMMRIVRERMEEIENASTFKPAFSLDVTKMYRSKYHPNSDRKLYRKTIELLDIKGKPENGISSPVRPKEKQPPYMQPGWLKPVDFSHPETKKNTIPRIHPLARARANVQSKAWANAPAKAKAIAKGSKKAKPVRFTKETITPSNIPNIKTPKMQEKLPSFPNADKQVYKDFRKLAERELVEDLYPLPPLLEKALISEMKDLSKVVCEACDPEIEKSPADEAISKFLKSSGHAEINTVLQVHTKKRILKTPTNLPVQIFTSKKIKKDKLEEFLRKYNATSLKMSNKSLFYVASFCNYKDFDDICKLKTVDIDDVHLKIKPMNLTGRFKKGKHGVKLPEGDTNPAEMSSENTDNFKIEDFEGEFYNQDPENQDDDENQECENELSYENQSFENQTDFSKDVTEEDGVDFGFIIDTIGNRNETTETANEAKRQHNTETEQTSQGTKQVIKASQVSTKTNEQSDATNKMADKTNKDTESTNEESDSTNKGSDKTNKDTDSTNEVSDTTNTDQNSKENPNNKDYDKTLKDFDVIDEVWDSDIEEILAENEVVEVPSDDEHVNDLDVINEDDLEDF